MSDYHTVYKGPEGETTQWEDIQTKLGNMARKPKPWKPDAYKPEEEQQVDKEFLANVHDEQQLQDLEGEFDDDRALEEYRCVRCAHSVVPNSHCAWYLIAEGAAPARLAPACS